MCEFPVAPLPMLHCLAYFRAIRPYGTAVANASSCRALAVILSRPEEPQQPQVVGRVRCAPAVWHDHVGGNTCMQPYVSSVSGQGPSQPDGGCPFGDPPTPAGGSSLCSHVQPLCGHVSSEYTPLQPIPPRPGIVPACMLRTWGCANVVRLPNCTSLHHHIHTLSTGWRCRLDDSPVERLRLAPHPAGHRQLQCVDH